MPRAMLRSSSSDALSSSRAVASSSASGLSGRAPCRRPGAGRRERLDEPLLGAVVEVALELAAGGVAGLDDAGARGAQVAQAGAQVGLQALVLERDPGRGGDGADELRLVLERGVVDHRGDRRAAALDERRDAAVGRAARAARRRRRRRPRTRAPSRRARASGRAARGRARRAARRGRPARAGRRAGRRSTQRARRARSRPTRKIIGTAVSVEQRDVEQRSRRRCVELVEQVHRRRTSPAPPRRASTGASARRSGALALT